LPAKEGADMPIAKTKLNKSINAVFFMIFSFLIYNFHDAAKYSVISTTYCNYGAFCGHILL
jgi:hypothetical protein